jgi:hypothetical protein
MPHVAITMFRNVSPINAVAPLRIVAASPSIIRTTTYQRLDHFSISRPPMRIASYRHCDFALLFRKHSLISLPHLPDYVYRCGIIKVPVAWLFSSPSVTNLGTQKNCGHSDYD